MTSLLLHPQPESVPKVYPEWGTGKGQREKANIWTPKRPTWQYSGEPIAQAYDLTALKRSNVRVNDQLLPTPQTSVLQENLIKKAFPAENPYASHVERKAVFPKFDSPSDPIRGVQARKELPKHPEMPANAYDVIVISKIKGNGIRQELQALPQESEKRALQWHEHSFDQEVKSAANDHAPYYPWPPKTLVPNLEERDEAICANGDMTISKRSATALRNIERDQWTTTYDRSHSGLGPSSPYKLDNYGDDADSRELKSTTIRTFDPPRPMEGRIARHITPAPQPDPNFPPRPKDSSYTPRKTRSEIEEDRLWNGTEYKNYPGGPAYPLPKAHEALEQETETQAFMPLSAEEQLHEDLAKAALRQHNHFQQVEATNRWKELELQTPDHDLSALNHKMAMANTKAQPKVFHDHENKYREERAGLYKTSYTPPAPEIAASEIFDTSQSHRNALNLDLDLNGDMHDALRYNRTLGGNGSVPQLHQQPSPYELFEPFNVAKQLQISKLHPTNPDCRVQEGHVNLKDSTYGGEFNVPMFLQEREMPSTARQEPTVLMSHQNQLLDNVRMVSLPGQPPFAASMPLPVKPASLVTGEAVDISRPRTAPENPFRSLQFTNRYSYQQPEIYTARASGPPTLSTASTYLPAYSARCASDVSRSLDLTFKDDERFHWKVGCGTPRPQTKLLQIQDSFSKTQVKKEFHARFPERNPDLRENLIHGKKHTFAGFNAQVLRGTPVLA